MAAARNRFLSGGLTPPGCPDPSGAGLRTGPRLRSGRRLRRGILQRRPFQALLQAGKHPRMAGGWTSQARPAPGG